MSVFDLRTYATCHDFEEFKKNENANEILPGLIQIKDSGENGGITYISKMLFPIGEKKVIILSDQTKDAIGLLYGATESKIDIEELFKLPDFDTANLNFGNLSENFQKATEQIKTKFEELFKK